MTNEEAIKMLKSKMDGHTDTSYEWAETVRMAIKAIKQTTWIPVNKRPPETGERVLVLFSDGFVMIGSYLDWEDGSPVTWVLDGQEDYNVDINNIVAWMSTPPSYKECEQ